MSLLPRCSLSVRGFQVLLSLGFLLSWLGAGTTIGSGDPVILANRLENQGIAEWRAGNQGRGAALIEQSLEVDPTNPQRPLNYGSLLMARGQEQLDGGDPEGAAASLSESERLLARAVRLGEGLPGRQALTGQGFFLLGEIAFYGRDDPERAAQFYLSAARRLPEDRRIREALERCGVEPPDPSSSAGDLAIGAVNTLTVGGERLRLTSEDVNERVSVKEYVRPGESIDNWSVLFARREHRQFVPPRRYASLLSEQSARQGGKVISAVAGPGDTASLAFVIHAPAMELSEVNVWQFLVEDGNLVSEQFAHRITGPGHEMKAEALARERSPGWIRELQDRHAIAFVRTSAVGESETDGATATTIDP